MRVGWTAIRYRAALSVSIIYATLIVGGLGAGGPQGSVVDVALGWVLLALFTALPALVWWTNDSPAAPFVQAIPLFIATSSVLWFLVLASQS